jgi:hypothetical protein
MIHAQNTAQAHIDNLPAVNAIDRGKVGTMKTDRLTLEGVSTIVGILRRFFEPGADWNDDIVPLLPGNGIGLLAVAIAEEVQRRAGTWALVDAMQRFLLGQLQTRGHRDRHVALALKMIADVREGRADTSDDEIFNQLDEACTPMTHMQCSLVGLCMLNVARSAIWAGRCSMMSVSWPALNIGNALVEQVGKKAACDFIQALREAGRQRVRAA